MGTNSTVYVVTKISNEFENIEIYVLLNWFVDDFESKSIRYNFSGNNQLIQSTLFASTQGRTLLALMKNPVEKIAKEFKLDIDLEANPTEIDGNSVNIPFLSFGFETNDLKDSKAINFIVKNIEEKLGIKVPPLRFKIFYLPPLPIATSDEGHIMHTQKGFTSIRKKRIEINAYPPRDYDSIFRNLVHEIFHVCLLEESSIEKVAEVESKVQKYVKIFFEKCEEDWKTNRNELLNDLENHLETNLSIFEQVNTSLNEYVKKLSRAKVVIDQIRIFFDSILYGEVIVSPI